MVCEGKTNLILPTLCAISFCFLYISMYTIIGGLHQAVCSVFNRCAVVLSLLDRYSTGNGPTGVITPRVKDAFKVPQQH